MCHDHPRSFHKALPLEQPHRSGQSAVPDAQVLETPKVRLRSKSRETASASALKMGESSDSLATKACINRASTVEQVTHAEGGWGGRAKTHRTYGKIMLLHLIRKTEEGTKRTT